MVTDALLKLIGSFFSFILGLLPSFDFLDVIIQAKDQLIDFLFEFMEYVLYVFNVPVLKLTMGIIITYVSFLAIEYTIKFILKYVTRIL